MALRPLIAICGTTGVGKSKLAIDLALQSFKGNHSEWNGARVINADAMQVYRGLDIITNKVPLGEQQGVEHLLMGFKNPGEQYVVGQWIQDAIPIIEETHHRKQIPIVVGGTSYWIQHLIFPNRLVSSNRTISDHSTNSGSETTEMSEKLARIVSCLPPELLYQFQYLPEKNPPSASTDPEAALALHRLLAALDPSLATRWHWRDTRKVLRSLQIIKETGRQASEIIKEQSQIDVQPRYHTLCFWIYADPSTLNPRLDARVDDMIQQGLLGEICTLRDIASSALTIGISKDHPEPPAPDAMANALDFTQGIFQSIGFKEFYKYVTSATPSEKSFNDAVERMKLSTRQYAKRQISWIRNKLLPAVNAANVQEQSVSMYLLDGTDIDCWGSEVSDRARNILDAFLNQRELPDPLTLSDRTRVMMTVEERPTSPTSVLDARAKVICPVCTVNPDQPVMIEAGQEWGKHQNTRRHRRLSKKLARAAATGSDEEDISDGDDRQQPGLAEHQGHMAVAANLT